MRLVKLSRKERTKRKIFAAAAIESIAVDEKLPSMKAAAPATTNKSTATTQTSKKRKVAAGSTGCAKKRKTVSKVNFTVPTKVNNTSYAGTTVFIANFPLSSSESAIAEALAECGKVVKVRLPVKRGPKKVKKGFGYVTFATEKAAQVAAALGSVTIGDRKVEIGPFEKRPTHRSAEPPVSAPTDTLFVANLPYTATVRSLTQFFGAHAAVTSVSRDKKFNSRRPNGTAHVRFASVDEAKWALETVNGEEFEGRAVRLEYAASKPPHGTPRGPPRRGPAPVVPDVPEFTPSDAVFIAKLPDTATEKALAEFCGRHGKVRSAFVPVDRDSGRPTGVARVKFASAAEAKKALAALRGAKFQGRTIEVY